MKKSLFLIVCLSIPSLIFGVEVCKIPSGCQIDEKGNVSGSVELAYLFGKDHSEVFTLNGQIDKKVWGESPSEGFFRIYMKLKKQ